MNLKMNQFYLLISLLIYQASAYILQDEDPDGPEAPDHEVDEPEPHDPDYTPDYETDESRRFIRSTHDHNTSDETSFMAVILHDKCQACGGVFLTPKAVLTLADCVRKGKTKIKVFPNIPNYIPGCDEDSNLFPIEKVHFAPGYDPRSHTRDKAALAIVYLEKPVAKVITPSIKYAGHLGGVDGSILHTLGIHRAIKIDTNADEEKCKLNIKAANLQDSQVICGKPASVGSKCLLIPGESIIVHDKGRIYLKGLLVDPTDCSHNIVLYTNVTAQSNWILSEIEQASGISQPQLQMRSRDHPTTKHISPEDIIVHKVASFPDYGPETRSRNGDPLIIHREIAGHSCTCECQRSSSGHMVRSNNNNNNNNGVKGDVVNSNVNVGCKKCEKPSK